MLFLFPWWKAAGNKDFFGSTAGGLLKLSVHFLMVDTWRGGNTAYGYSWFFWKFHQLKIQKLSFNRLEQLSQQQYSCQDFQVEIVPFSSFHNRFVPDLLHVNYTLEYNGTNPLWNEENERKISWGSISGYTLFLPETDFMVLSKVNQ